MRKCGLLLLLITAILTTSCKKEELLVSVNQGKSLVRSIVVDNRYTYRFTYDDGGFLVKISSDDRTFTYERSGNNLTVVERLSSGTIDETSSGTLNDIGLLTNIDGVPLSYNNKSQLVYYGNRYLDWEGDVLCETGIYTYYSSKKNNTNLNFYAIESYEGLERSWGYCYDVMSGYYGVGPAELPFRHICNDGHDMLDARYSYEFDNQDRPVKVTINMTSNNETTKKVLDIQY